MPWELTTSARRDAAIVGAVALTIRLIWVVVWGRTSAGLNDTLFYEVTAASLAHGDGFISIDNVATAHWPPGFPFLVSLGYRVFGDDPNVGLGLNAVFGAGTAVLLYAVGARLFGRAGGLFAGAAFAALPGPIIFTGLFMSETTYIFMLVGFVALALFLPDRRWTPVALGVAVGLSALTKGEGVLLLVIPLAMWAGHHPRREYASRAAVLILAAVLTVAPWTIRNAIAMDAFIPVSTNASTTLWSGHNDNANGAVNYPPRDLIERIPRGIGPQRFEVEEARLLRREAVDWAVAHPLQELTLIPRKLIALNEPTSSVFDIWYASDDGASVPAFNRLVFGVLSDAGGYFLLGLTLASVVLLGLRRLWRIHPVMQGVLAYLAGCLVIYGFVYYGQFRYRIPAEPLMILVSAPLAAAAWSLRAALREIG
jgi:4-amino-4-deoxy-L-arabinose transferase-like glycosyltransferase